MEVRYIEIKTSPAGQIIRAYTPEQYKKEMARRKNATARARKLTRLQERVGAVLAMLGLLMLLGAGGMCEIGQIIGYGLAGLFLFVFGVWLAHGFYGQADKLFENQQLFRQPIVRNGRQATVGYCPEVWEKWE